jgi:signal transduction histidine kinase
MEKELTKNLYFVLVVGSLGMMVLVSGLLVFLYGYYKRRIRHLEELKHIEIQHGVAMLKNSIDVQEREKQRLAADLHDDLGAILSAVRLNFSRISAQLDTPFVSETKEMIDIAITEVRKISHSLSPAVLEQFGLSRAVADMFHKIEQASGLDVELDIEDLEQNRLESKKEISLYRVLSELLNNTLKHSKADKIELRVYLKEDHLFCVYSDNGQGCDPDEIHKKGGMGLKNIESRMQVLEGSVTFESKPAEGMVVKMQIPVK